MSEENRPAILGGTPAVTEDYQLANQWPQLTSEDETAVLRVMRDGDLTTHPEIRELEKDYAHFVNRRYALAHNNGTSALLASFFALDLKPGDEVLVPTGTFWASVLPMLWLGVVPVFCESEEERLGLCPNDLEKKITDKTKAIVVVHLWGMPCKMTEIFEIAKKYKLKIVEDASHSHGAKWRGKEGCMIEAPRYPLLHEQPFFTEGHFAQIARLPSETKIPTYNPDDFSKTRKINAYLLKLPAFSSAGKKIIDQYLLAFEKVVQNSREIAKISEKNMGGVI